MMNIDELKENIANDPHFTIIAAYIHIYKNIKKVSERDLAKAIGMTKSEMHRMLLIGGLDSQTLWAARHFKIEKYVLLTYAETKREEIRKGIINGTITKYSQVKRYKQRKVSSRKTVQKVCTLCGK